MDSRGKYKVTQKQFTTTFRVERFYLSTLPNYLSLSLPDLALLGRVHRCVQSALELRCKFIGVGKRTDDAELWQTVRVGEDGHMVVFRSTVGTPHLH